MEKGNWDADIIGIPWQAIKYALEEIVFFRENSASRLIALEGMGSFSPQHLFKNNVSRYDVSFAPSALKDIKK